MSNRSVLISFGGLAVVALGGWLVLKPSGSDASRASSEWPSIRVSASPVAASILATGTIKAQVGAEVKVGSQVSGIVRKLNVKVGDTVVKGQVLAQLDDSSLRSQVAAHRAGLARATAELQQSERDLRRSEDLAARSLISISDLEEKREQRDIAAANVALSKAALEGAEIDLARTTIVAPTAGTIASVSTYEGETVAASFTAPTFVTIINLDRLEVQAYVDEVDIRHVKPGQPVSFRVEAFPGETLTGRVRAINPKALLVNNVVNYVVVIDIEDKKGLEIRPEMTVHVSFVVDHRDSALTVPRSAVLTEGDRRIVFVRTGDGWEKRNVVIGVQTPQQLEIASGLRPGEVVLTDARLAQGKGTSE